MELQNLHRLSRDHVISLRARSLTVLQLCASVSVSCLTVSIYHGYGNSNINVSLDYFFMRSKYLIVATFFSQTASGVGKASVASFLLAMQGRAHVRSGYFLYFLGATNVSLLPLPSFTLTEIYKTQVAINLTFSFMLMFLCNPPEPVWRNNPDPKTCHVPALVSYRFNVFQCGEHPSTPLKQPFELTTCQSGMRSLI